MHEEEETRREDGAREESAPSGSLLELRESLLENGSTAGSISLPKDFDWDELYTIWLLAYPLLVSFCCRMLMASTDSSFVGHLNTRDHPAEDYLVAATLSGR